MEIRGSSWHYKYVAKRWTHDPKALCWYFWKIVLSIFLMAVLGVLSVVVGIGAIIAILFPIWVWFFPHYPVDTPTVATILWLFIGGFSSYTYRQNLYETGRLKRKVKVHKEPGLMSQYLHAKHRKICPLLEYKRGE